MHFSKENNVPWIFEILDSRFDEVTFYAPTKSNDYKAVTTGILHQFDTRQYNHKNFVFDIPVAQDAQEHYYYLKIKPGVIGIFLFKVRQVKIFSSYSITEYLLLGFYYGILLIMGFYNLFIFISIRERVYLYYFLYLITWAFNSSLDDGLGYQYIWSSFPYVTKVGPAISRIFMLVFYILYSVSFLNLSLKLNKDSILSKVAIVLFLTITTITVLFNHNHFYNWIFTFTFGYISYKSFIINRRGYKPARFLFIGNAIIAVGMIIYILKIIGLFTSISEKYSAVHIFMVYIRNITMITDIVILSIALSDRMRFLKTTAELAQKEAYNQLNEKKLLSEKVNRELEQKVSERTQELEKQKQLLEEQKQLLEQANNKLQLQSEEISRMNALLDLDNWNLKKNIIEEKEARINLKEINFEEFQLVYPNDAAVFRYLEELKDEKEYRCRKCGHTKYGKGYTQFSKRCLNCRYDESVTSYTVFNRCKFSIQIAMYIAVKINRHGKEVSISDISREVKLRNGTCSKFAQKLLTTRDTKEYKQANEDEKIKVLILNNYD
jgi:rubrerythrin